jgi:flagellar basal body-associated protein FliL
MVEQAKAKPNKGTDNGEEFSLEDLDKVLAEEDPDFQQSLEAIRTDLKDSAAQIVDLTVATEDENEVEIDLESLPKYKQIIYKILIPIKTNFRKLIIAMGQKSINFSNWVFLSVQQNWQFLRYELPDRIRYLKSQLKAIIGFVTFYIKNFFRLSRAQKVATLCILVAALSAAFFVSKIFVPKWLPTFSLTVLENWADEGRIIGTVKSRADFIAIFDAYPEQEYSVRLKKVVVNLKRTDDSGSNPMALFELYLALDAQATAIEVKDREKEILDHIQRTIEEFTYNEITSEAGKVRMKEAIRLRVNDLLNQGTVRNVYINRMVIHH